VPFRLKVVTPERALIDTEVDSVIVPGSEGEFGVLPGHELFLAPLLPGVVEYAQGGERRRLAVSGGFAEVTQERVTLLARTAEFSDEIDVERAEAALERARTGRQDAGLAAPANVMVVLEAAAARAAARLRAVGA
jgi:F-type H+-transporting ATPase subunit epsilon